MYAEGSADDVGSDSGKSESRVKVEHTQVFVGIRP